MVNQSKAKLTIIPRRLKHLDTLLECRSRISFVIWGVDRGQQSDVHTKVLVGQLASLPNCLAESVWVWLGQGSEDPETTRV